VREDQPRAGRPAAQGARELSRAREAGAPSGRRIARNTLFSGVGEASNLILFFLGFLAARWLAPTAFGEYSTAFAFVGLFRLLPDFGMSYASTLAISRDRSIAARTASNLLGFQALLSAVTLALCLGLGRLLYEDVTWIAVLVLSVDLVLKVLKSTLRWLLKALERFAAEAVSLLLERTAILILGAASLAAGGGVVGFVLAFALVRVFDTAGLAAYMNARVLPLRLAFDRRVWGQLLWRGLPFAYAGLMITLFFQVDAVMLEAMRGSREVGWYRAPVLVLEGLTLVPRVLSYALIPTMAALHATNAAAVTALYRRGCKYLLLAGLPIAAFGVLAAGPFVSFLFGAEYAPSVAAARVLLPAAAFMFLSNFGETTLACVNRWATIVVISTACLLLNVGLNLVWIPRHGYLGAAWATLVTEAAYFVLGALALSVHGHRVHWASLAARPILAAGVFAAVLYASRAWPPLVSAALACAAFAAATVVLRVWDPQERQLVLEMLRHGAPQPEPLA
jgi:O-antigen/teichoic acid export membrane protein